MNSPDWHKYLCADISICDTSYEQNIDNTHTAPGRAVFLDAGRMWPNGKTLDYCFLNNSPGTPAQQHKVRHVVSEWEKYANIRFEHVDSQGATIRIAFDSLDGSWSHIGQDVKKVALDEPTMNLGCVDVAESLSPTDKGIILHEFGHVLGLGHEHQSPSREGKITLKEEVVMEYYTTRRQDPWSRQDVQEQILNVYNLKDVSNYSKLDPKSIMMYFMPAEMNEEHLDVRPNNELSDVDKAYMTINYPFDSSNPNNEGWTVERALAAVGVGDIRKMDILKSYEHGDWVKLREQFGLWCICERLGRRIRKVRSARW